MDLKVSVEVARLRERLLTVSALVGFLLSMSPDVNLEDIISRKFLSTDQALKRLFICVLAPSMILKVPFSGESSLADFTLVLFYVVMSIQVVLETIFIIVVLVAVLPLTI